jgi:hypothetical protein
MLGMTATYRLQFLSEPTAQGATVLIETTVVAGGFHAAIRQAVEVAWPPGATALRILDLDGREVYERTKVDRR